MGGDAILTNTQLLKDAIEMHGLKYKFIASKLNLSPYGLTKKINGTNQFKAEEISILCQILDLSFKQKEDIFFKGTVE